MSLSILAAGQKLTASILNAIINAVNPSGSAIVLPSSVSVGSGSKAISALGKVTFTGASSVQLNGVFSALYDNYLVIVDVPTTSTANFPAVQLAAAGAPDSSANYDHEKVEGSVNAASAVNVPGTTSWFATGNRVTWGLEFKLLGPALAQRTGLLGTLFGFNAAGANAQVETYGGQHRLASAYDGLVLAVASGTMSGTIAVYGYNKS